MEVINTDNDNKREKTRYLANIILVKRKLLLTLMSISLTSRTVKNKNALPIVHSLSYLKITRKINIFLSVNLLLTTL